MRNKCWNHNTRCRGWIGDYQITGKHGHVLASSGCYYLYVTGTAQRWNKAKRTLPGTVTQDGDDEGIIRLDRLPAPAEAEAIRDVIGIRRRRHLTAEAKAALLLRLEAHRKAFSASPTRLIDGPAIPIHEPDKSEPNANSNATL